MENKVLKTILVVVGFFVVLYASGIFTEITGFTISKYQKHDVLCVYDGTTQEGPSVDEVDPDVAVSLNLYDTSTGRYLFKVPMNDRCMPMSYSNSRRANLIEAYCEKKDTDGGRRDSIKTKYTYCEPDCKDAVCVE